ncbi:squalene synthetase-like protein [Kalmusia sp. IMI 367209]|nr:squalene synthetase-like protein [Kalmusia sp. IMI 367209]
MAKKKAKGKGPAKTNTRGATPRQLSSRFGARAQLQEAAAAVTRQFSLRDEARYMSSHRSAAFDTSKRLRHMPVTFVSAGCLEGTVQEKPAASASPSLSPSPSRVAIDALAQMTIRSPSPTPSASSSASSELIVFRGRGQTPLTLLTPSATSLPAEQDAAPSVAALTAGSHTEADSNTHQTASSTNTPYLRGTSSEEQASLRIEVATSTVAVSSMSAKGRIPPDATQDFTNPAQAREPLRAQDASDVDSDTNSVIDTHFEKRRGGRPVWEGHVIPWESRSKPGIGWLPVKDRPSMDTFFNGDFDHRDAAMDDYMQNVEDLGLTDNMVAAAGFARREMDLDAGSHNDWKADAADAEPDLPAELEDDQGWNSDDLRDLDGMSTSTDVEDIVDRILGARIRGTGRQYLVVYEGSTPDDSRWLPATFLTSPSDQRLIKAFEARQLSRAQNMAIDSESDSSDSSDSEFDIDGSLDEAISDEQIARAFQKQEELGIDSDDLVLHAADEYFAGPATTSASARSGISQVAFARPNKKRQQRVGGGRRTEPSFPSASAMADALDMDPYGAFDIMDTERPSLRLKKKGRRGRIPPELDDSDLNEQMQASWEADRTKKRLKKAEREELRKQGLLGRKGKGADLSVKYKEGFVMEEVIDEIRTFMVSGMQTLSLPPMEAHRRAAVHQFVHNLGLTSRSRGDGATRFTVLSKTSRTGAFDDDAFDALLDQKKFKHRLLRVERLATPSKKRDKSGKTRPTVSYRDGEVVGASAPELGPENKGRALLEKMGWSKGQALGAVDNKGILQPIAHTVKITKAGLR